jgi:hypothetical protein
VFWGREWKVPIIEWTLGMVELGYLMPEEAGEFTFVC